MKHEDGSEEHHRRPVPAREKQRGHGRGNHEEPERAATHLGRHVGQCVPAAPIERLDVAGLEIMEARLTHLAYATEIASAMLQRQQAAAILAARQIIVDGAVGMAQMAILRLEEEAGASLDEERKMNMINNLMVSIITDKSSQPVINVGSMY